MPSTRSLVPAAAVGCLLLLATLAPAGAGAALTPADSPTESDTEVTQPTNATVTNVSVWVGPAELEDLLTNASAVRTAQRTGSLTERIHAPLNRTIVLEMRAPGLDGRMARVDGPNETARFLGATYDEDSAITFVQSSSPGPSAYPDAFQLDRPNATAVIADQANDTYYLRLYPEAADRGNWRPGDHTDEFTFESETPNGWSIDKGYSLQVTIDGRTQTFRGDGDWDERAPVVRFLKDDGPTEAFDDTFEQDRLVLDRSTRAPVEVKTTLSHFAPVTVRITNRSDGGPPISDTRTPDRGSGTSADGHDWNGVVTDRKAHV